MQHLRVGTRKSPLAIWQAQNWIKRMRSIHPNITCELVPTCTLGDRTQGELYNVGGKGLFSKDLHLAMEQGNIDCAVHSLKDVETVPGAPTPWNSSFVNPNIAIASVYGDNQSIDVLITSRPKCQLVATDSIRRRNQLRLLMPGIRFTGARGNITTRLGLVSGEVDGTILALAGLRRLNLWKSGPYLEAPFQHLSITPLTNMVPAAGQGVLTVDAIEPHVRDIIATTNDSICWQQCFIERRVLQILGADCHTSIGLKASDSGVKWFYQARFGNHPHSPTGELTAQKLAAHLQSLTQMT